MRHPPDRQDAVPNSFGDTNVLGWPQDRRAPHDIRGSPDSKTGLRHRCEFYWTVSQVPLLPMIEIDLLTRMRRGTIRAASRALALSKLSAS